MTTELVSRARRAAAGVTDPELPGVSVVDLGIIRDIEVDDDGAATVTITPTFSGCPALVEIRRDLDRRLRAAGFENVRIDTRLSPPWSSDWITPAGREALRRNEIAPPLPVASRSPGPVAVSITTPAVDCPHCGSSRTTLLSSYGAAACRGLRRCEDCLEPFEAMKSV